MTTRTLAWIAALVVAASLAAAPPLARQPASAPPYSVDQRGGVVRLDDAIARTSVSIVPAVGNIAFDMTINGQKILHWPYTSMDEFKARPAMSGIPFMAPWANRLDEQAFYANGARYAFDMSLGNVRGAIPIHGFVTTTDKWRVVEAKADGNAAWLTSRLDFFREPAWMKQWPFAHTIEMTYRLERGTLEVTTVVANASAAPMPVAVGFHPYFRLTDAPRDDWRVSLGARTHWLLTPAKLPSGETEPIANVLADAGGTELRGRELDDVFGDLVRDDRGRAVMRVTGRSQRLEVALDPQYRAVVVWAPKGAPFVCVEPMAGVTNAINLAQRHQYDELQSVAPGGSWRASFWITPSGF